MNGPGQPAAAMAGGGGVALGKTRTGFRAAQERMQGLNDTLATGRASRYSGGARKRHVHLRRNPAANPVVAAPAEGNAPEMNAVNDRVCSPSHEAAPSY